MSNTIFTGMAVLPKKFVDYTEKTVDVAEFEHELVHELGERYRTQVIQKPYLSGFGLGKEGEEYVVNFFTTKPIEEIEPSELKELREMVGEFKVNFEFSGIAVGGGFEDSELKLMSEIEAKHGKEIRQRPYTYGFIVQKEGEEHVLLVFTTKQVEELKPDELQKLQEPVAGLKVKLETGPVNH